MTVNWNMGPAGDPNDTASYPEPAYDTTNTHQKWTKENLPMTNDSGDEFLEARTENIKAQLNLVDAELLLEANNQYLELKLSFQNFKNLAQALLQDPRNWEEEFTRETANEILSYLGLELVTSTYEVEISIQQSVIVQVAAENEADAVEQVDNMDFDHIMELVEYGNDWDIETGYVRQVD